MSSSPAPIPFARSMLHQHRHVCAFFNSADDEYGTLLPFICEGIGCGHRAFHVLPSQHRREHLDRLTAAGVDVAATQKSGQLEVAASEDTYTRGGRFNKEAMLVLIQEVLTTGTSLGFPLTRLIAHAETTCADWGGANEFMEYEMRLNEVLPNYDDPVICAYDANLSVDAAGRDSIAAAVKREIGRAGGRQAIPIANPSLGGETEMRRFVALVESSADFVGYADLEGTARYVNPAGMRLVGLGEHEPVPRLHILEFLVPEDRARARKEAWPIVA